MQQFASVRRAIAVAILIGGAAVAAWLLWPRPPASDEDRIRRLVDEMAQAAEKKDIGGILEHVSERYRGESTDKDGLRGTLFVYLRGAQFVSVIVRGLTIDVKGDEADAKMRVLLTRAKVTQELRVEDLIQSGAHRIEAGFAREGTEWKVVKASRRDIPFAQAIAP